MRFAFLALLVLPAAAESRFDRFDRDLARIREELRIPKLSAAVVEDGKVVWRRGAGIDGPPLEQSATAVRVMHLLEEERIELDDPVGMPAGATVGQVLSNTADGPPGEEYVYNTDFLRWVGQSVAPVSAPSTFEDLTRYAIELDTTLLISEKSKAAMFAPVMSPHGVTMPRGLGWFSQEYSGERVVWDFAQNDNSSTLLVKLPSRKLTLIAVASSKALTEAAHLEDGNIARSSVALAFLEHVVFGRDFARDDTETRAIEALYLGNRDQSAALARATLERFPELETADDLTLLRLLSQLHFSATESVATVVIAEHPSLPEAWFYYGMYLENAKRYREAAACFEQITEHQPPWHHWTASAAKKELATLE